MRLLYACLLAAPLLAQSAFVRVSPRDPRYLELSDGTPYIPNGPNMIGPPYGKSPEDAFKGLESWLSQLSANGGNYVRFWLSTPFFDVEHQKSGVYDEEKALRIERALALCRKYGIRAKLTLEHFRSIGGGKQAWADKPLHNVTNGGAANTMADFFDGEASRALFREKIRWYGKRFGAQPVIYAWELWNEVNAVNGAGKTFEWTAAMLPELHKTFPQNMALQSLGSFDSPRSPELYRRFSTMPGNDLAQVHRYLDLGARLEVCKGPVDVLAADAVRELIGYNPGRPVLLAESGAVEPSHAGPFKLYKVDTQGMLLHDILFAPFFAGAAGAGQVWHWDSYVAANNLWWHYGRFAAVVKGLDPVAEGFTPSLETQDRFRVYTLKGRKTTLLWVRDSRNTWETELKNGEKPEALRNVQLKVAGRTKGTVKVYDPWTNRWSEAKIKAGKITLPEFSRSIVVKL